MVNLIKAIDHQSNLAKAQARMRTATTHAALDRAISKVDLAVEGILAGIVVTRADADFHGRANDWVSDRPRIVAHAHNAITNMEMYRQRRVAPDRPYARKETVE